MSLCINPVCSKPDHPNNEKNRFCQSCGSQLELLGRYRVMHLISNTTGFGTVYAAYEQNTAKILKVFKENFANDICQEAVVLGHLNHPGIPKVDSYFQHQTRNGLILHCIISDKIDGINLEEWLQQQQKPISQAKAITWLKQLAEILDLVHSKLYLHLDIQPSNIILQPNGQLVLINFGTARTDHSGTIAPTLLSSYIAPEQMKRQAAPQSDFFGLGRAFVFLLTGKHPLDIYDVRQNLLDWHNYVHQISPQLLNLIDWLIAPELKNRPTNAQFIWQRLDKIEQEQNPNIEAINNFPKNQQNEQIIQLKPNLNSQKKVSLIALFTALLVSIGLLNIVALIIGYPKFALSQTQNQLPDRKGKIDYFTYVEGRDRKGRIAKFNIAILSIEYKWLLGSNFQIKNNDKIISLDVLKLNLEQEDIQQMMENPSEIISVGTSSCEGSLAVSQRLALERSQQVQILVKKIFKNTPSVKGYRLLNLGKFQRSNCQNNRDLTAYQKNIMIIGIKRQSRGVIIDEALRDRLENKSFADFKIEDYSLGSGAKFRTIPSKL